MSYGEEERIEWNLNQLYIVSLGELVFGMNKLFLTGNYILIHQQLRLLLINISMKVGAADREVYDVLKNDLRLVGQRITAYMKKDERFRKGVGGMVEESRIHQDLIDFFEKIMNVLDLAELLVLKRPSKDLVNYLQRLKLDRQQDTEEDEPKTIDDKNEE